MILRHYDEKTDYREISRDNLIREIREALAAPSPAQEKPVAASVEEWRARDEGGIGARSIYTVSGRLICPEVPTNLCIAIIDEHNAALATASSPSEDTKRLDWLSSLSMFNYDEHRDHMTNSTTYGQVDRRTLFTIPSQHVSGQDLRDCIDAAMSSSSL